MNKKTTVALLMLLASATANSQKIIVKDKDMNCGKIEYSKPATVTFKMKNKRSKQLLIDDVKVSCGCLKAEYPKQVVQADQDFEIKLTYDARQMGHFFKEAAVYSNGSKTPIYLTMKGIVVEEVTDYSGEYPYKIGDLRVDKTDLEFDDVNKGDRPSIVLHLINDGTKVLQPNIMHLPPYLEVASSVEYLRPGHQGKLTVTLNSDKLNEYGITQTSVYLANNPGDKVSAENELTAAAVLLPQFAQLTETQRLNAPAIKLSANNIKVDFSQKDKHTEKIEIMNTGKSNLQISSIHMFSKALKLTLGKRELKPAEKTTLKVTVEKEPFVKARTKPRILMITNDPNKPKIELKVEE